MSEMNTTEAIKQNVGEYLAERRQWLADAVEVVTGNRELDPLAVFPPAAEVRSASQALDLTVEQEVALREIANKFGVGGEVDVFTSAEHVVIEGGKPWKVEAELELAKTAMTIIVAGSPDRKIGEDEMSYMHAKLGVFTPSADEYGMVSQLVAMQPGYEELDLPQILPFGYDILNGHSFVAEPTGQMILRGYIQGRPIIHLRIDRENYFDETEQKNEYQNQPDSAAVMGIISDVLAACGDNESSVGMLTSSTYASRVIDAKRAGLKKSRNFDVGMYGRQTLANVKSETLPKPTDINQIPGELHTIYVKLSQLESEV